MDHGLLRRWSQRKQAARRAAPASSAPPVDPARVPEEPVPLPSLDALTADSDTTGFLRAGVPEALRNAALRKVWTLDPAIRDFAGHARDYAYDWNQPGGVPGSGPLEPAQVAALVRQVFGDPPPTAADSVDTDAADAVATTDVRAGASDA